MKTLCRQLSRLSLLLLMPTLLHAEDLTRPAAEPVELEFGGYRFGQSPAANMVCSSGFCKSQAPGGDGRITYPFSTYTTPGAVSTLSGLIVVNARYTFWEDHLYRVFFQVDCAPQATEECFDDLVKALDREYALTPLSANNLRQFVTGRHTIIKEFVTESGAIVRMRAASNADEWQRPSVDIVDKGVANQVGSTLSPSYKPKELPLPATLGGK